jgi:hypothetical protein
MFDPTGLDRSTIEFNYMRLRIDFVTDSATETPILEGITIRFIMRPKTLYGYSFQIPAGTFIKKGTSGRDNRTANEIIEDLRTARESYAPVSFVDAQGNQLMCYIASYEERAVQYYAGQEIGGTPNIESVVTVNLVELG